MGEELIAGVLATPLKIIPVEGGDVYHAMKSGDAGYCGFGEAYFSTVLPGAVKAWKRHNRMTLNLVVISGRVRFVLYDDRSGSPNVGVTAVHVLGPPDRYIRLTVPPGIWMAFQGVADGTSILLNAADLAHDPEEADRLLLDAIPFDWRMR